ncbi:MAG: CGNR zinc finger domain-containing protein [Oculatellaceae cyanobacterium Prado106]|jgi:predicted RNA-binding Zn ribbon-like protein|nr:CGNR zinc finger domain-containing protein [Oculatellaceae cyanobacterium Prado106]
MNTHHDWTQLKCLGGRLCLDFINTVDRAVEQTGTREESSFSSEWLTDAIALINWAQQVQLLSPAQTKTLKKQAQQQPELAQDLFVQAIAFRESLYHLFSAVSVGQAPPLDALAVLNRWLTAACSQSQLVWCEAKFVRRLIDTNQLEFILWRVAQSAEELLLDPMLTRVRECAGTDCGWIFLDTSRNRSRRWCDMEDCGNRAKAKRHYERNKQ